MAKISVVSPVYNVEKYIKNFIISLDKQTFKDFELILVNDGTLDNSIKIATDTLKDTSIDYKIINKKNGGQSSARNQGLKKANGEWICMLDSDDIIQPKYLENLVKVIELTTCDVVFCDLNRVTDENIFDVSDDEFIFELKEGKSYFTDFIMHNVEIGPYSLLINRDYIRKTNLLFDEKSSYSEEFIFICSLLYDSPYVVHLKQKLYNYCLRPGSVSTGANVSKIINGFNRILESNRKYEKCNCLNCQIYNKYAISRWILATARFTSKNMRYSDYKKLMKSFNYKDYIRNLYNFPSLKIRISSRMLNTSLLITYMFFRNWGAR